MDDFLAAAEAQPELALMACRSVGVVRRNMALAAGRCGAIGCGCGRGYCMSGF
jgi:hypothetical protein